MEEVQVNWTWATTILTAMEYCLHEIMRTKCISGRLTQNLCVEKGQVIGLTASLSSLNIVLYRLCQSSGIIWKTRRFLGRTVWHFQINAFRNYYLTIIIEELEGRTRGGRKHQLNSDDIFTSKNLGMKHTSLQEWIQYILVNN